jgi:hypothetical protein
MSKQPNSEKTAIITILSAPRSGSSALSRVLASMGVWFGPRRGQLRATPFNPHGFFETEMMLELNEKILRTTSAAEADSILRTIGLTPVDLERISRPWYWSAAWTPCTGEEILAEDINLEMAAAADAFGSGHLSAWKDARFCMTLPLWERYIRPIPILLWRHPVEVAQSLERMMGVPGVYGQHLWAAYTHASFRVTEAHNRYVVGHRMLVDAPESVIAGIAEFLDKEGLGASNSEGLDIAAAAARVDSSLVTKHGNDNEIASAIEPLYDWLTRGAPGEPPKLHSPPFDVAMLRLIGAVGRLYHDSRALRSIARLPGGIWVVRGLRYLVRNRLRNSGET